MHGLKIDDLDLEILQHLVSDSKITLKELSKKIVIPPSTIHARIKKMEKQGIIDRYTLKINFRAIGLEIMAFVMISFDKNQTNLDQVEVARKISKIPKVQEVYIIAGEFDILLKVRALSIDDLSDLVVKELKKINGVGHTLTHIVLTTIKESDIFF